VWDVAGTRGDILGHVDQEVAVSRLVSLIASVPVTQIVESSQELVLRMVKIAVDEACYWGAPDDEDVVYALPAIREAFRAIADALAASPHTRSWGDSVDLGHQCVISYELDGKWQRVTPTGAVDFAAWRAKTAAEERSAQRNRPLDPAAPHSGFWWSTPVGSGALKTTVAVEGPADLRLALVEDYPGWVRARVSPVAIDRPPRIYEITGPARWAELVSTYPFAVTAARRHDWYRTTGQVHEWFIPDWSAVAVDYDAVHLTMWGYLTTPGLAIPVDGGATVLAGWDPDATYWLHPEIIEYTGHVMQWRMDGERWMPQ
jgi:hypothetical protein